jgi:hypothetical protein
VWVVDVRGGYHEFRDGGPGHFCPNVDCNHHDQYETQVVRLMCETCGVVRIYTGEFRAQETTTTRNTGYGQRPRRIGGLWLYPGPPIVYGEADPWDYLVSRAKVPRLTPADVVGWIGQTPGPRGGTAWKARARPEPMDPDWDPAGLHLRYTLDGGGPFKTIPAAARWIQTHLT